MMVMRNKMQNLRELDLTNATIVANSFNYGTGVSQDNVFPDFMTGKSLTNILLPASITSIGNNALKDCKNIKEIRLQRGWLLRWRRSKALSSGGRI